MDLECACCGAVNTVLAQSPETGLWVCEDRELCRQAMIIEGRLKRVSGEPE